jgi:helix-turn-helix protein
MRPIPLEQRSLQKHIPPPAELAPLLYRISDAVMATGLCRSKIYQLIDAGELVTCHFGRSVRIIGDSLHALIERRTEPARQPPAPSEARQLLSKALARQGRKPARGKDVAPGAPQP